jgi:uncharacterized membrane protein YvlD (DUF360 family)
MEQVLDYLKGLQMETLIMFIVIALFFLIGIISIIVSIIKAIIITTYNLIIKPILEYFKK